MSPVAISKLEKAYNFMIDKLLSNFWVLLLLNTLFSFGIQIQSKNQFNDLFSINVNIAFASIILILELGGLSFMVLKIK